MAVKSRGTELKVGDRVGYADAFASNARLDRRRRGEVIGVTPGLGQVPDVVKILWEDDPDPKSALASNLKMARAATLGPR